MDEYLGVLMPSRKQVVIQASSQADATEQMADKYGPANGPNGSVNWVVGLKSMKKYD